MRFRLGWWWEVQETGDVVPFRVKRVDDRLVKTSMPGQYVTVKVLMPDGVHQPRQYRLTRGRASRCRRSSSRHCPSCRPVPPTARLGRWSARSMACRPIPLACSPRPC
ncbi:protein of unknown function [Modestobacter italicus]|uniref:FAD-binding FR-type domain-containing protein n=1 Tax=Modestobacter italicus (strain DSM 44449 / CECT 9708 / BC 501) TaxID=2732864 RepID=I4EYM4_MODI5|nr:protein of unknown function [Modestobacter marinus]